MVEAGKKAHKTRKKHEEELKQSMNHNASAMAPSRMKQEKQPDHENGTQSEETLKWHSTAISSATLKVKGYGQRMTDYAPIEEPWVEKHRPVSLSQCIGQVIPLLQAYVKTGSMPQCFVFYGPYGMGKSTSAKAMCRDFYVLRGLFHKDATFRDVVSASNITRDYQGIFSPVLYIDASQFKGSENETIEEVKTRIYDFMRYSAGKVNKFCVVDESDRFGFAVQDNISSYIERYPSTRIIWITNYLDAIRDRIVSRAAGGVIEFVKPDAEDVAKYLTRIAKAEHAKIKSTDIMEIAEKSPSVRDAVGMLQQKAVIIKCER
jgi:replication-associated recombination protein RarA